MSTILATTTIVQVSTITSGPALNDQQFQGWYLGANSSEAIDCDTGSSLWTTAGYAQCCGIGSICTDLATRCDGNTRVGVTSTACDDDWRCLTMTIFDQYGQTGARWSQLICAPSVWSANSIYRTILAATTSTQLSIVTSFLAATSQPLSIASSTTSLASVPSSISISTTTTSASPSSAWIAGPVVGSLAVVGIILSLIWMLRRRSRMVRPVYPEYGKRWIGSGEELTQLKPTYQVNVAAQQEPYEMYAERHKSRVYEM